MHPRFDQQQRRCLRFIGQLSLVLMVASGVLRADPAAGFRRLDPGAAGLLTTNHVPSTRYLTNQIYLNGSGIALGDVNGDGRPDAFVAGASGAGRLYLNQGGWKFREASTNAFPGLPANLDTTGTLLADFNGDAHLDLVLNTVAQGTWVLLNDGQGTFQARPPLNLGKAGMSAAAADLDGDGDLDLYVANYRPVTMRDEPNGKFGIKQDGARQHIVTYNGRPTTAPDLAGRFYLTPTGVKENGEPDLLMLNDGQGNFTAVSWTGGAFLDEDGKPIAALPHDWGLSVLLRDLNGDGKPDIYVCNDFESPDRCWLNETQPGGPLRFRALSTVAQRNSAAFSMGVDAADINRDGHDDLFVLDMLSRDHRLRNVQVDALPTSHHAPGLWRDRPQMSRNTLFLGRGDGTFAEVGRLAGLAASEWAWTPIFLDVDLDGFEDLLVSNGHEMDMMDADAAAQAEMAKARRPMNSRELLDLRRLFRRFAAPKAAFRNLGNLSFADVSTAWGFDQQAVIHGMALADLDGDGDLDVVANSFNDQPGLYENLATAPRLAVRLKGRAGNTQGVGARITVRGGPVPEQSQVVMAGGRYLSGDDPLRVFAAGEAKALSVEVRWPGGAVTRIADAAPNRTLIVDESSAQPAVVPAPSPVRVWFSDVSATLNHVPVEAPFDDFARQPLLARNQGEAGPGVTWGDLDDDGLDDLVIGGGAGGTLAAFRGDGTGRFTRLTNAVFGRPLARDLTTVLVQSGTLIAGASNYEDGRTNGGALRLVDLGRNVTGDSLTGQAMSAGPLALADVDGDGSPEIFLGGRALAGRYPETTPSLLVTTAGGRFSVVQRIESPGPVNGAVFTDVDGDGDGDLVLAAEWSPLRVLRNDGGRFMDITEAAGLAGTTGWWNSVAVADLDEDGRPDLIAGNWGWNSFPVPRAPLDLREPAPANRRRIRWGDLDSNGVTDLIESYFDAAGRELPYRKFDQVAAAMPFVREKFTTRGDYGAATLAEIYGDKLNGLPVREAATFGTTVFLNRGGRFEPRTLPAEAQFAPTYGVAVADFDGDGHDDVFLAQNVFAVSTDESRQDGGRGLLLRGDGKGNLTPVPGQEGGLLVYGEGRGAAVADFDRDGRTDLAVGQNANQTRLFRNVTGRPGLRVRLKGQPGNPAAVGASLRLFAGEQAGALRELHAGSGYWSVDSSTVVLTHPQPATRLVVRWPNGNFQTNALPAGARAVAVNADGTMSITP